MLASRPARSGPTSLSWPAGRTSRRATVLFGGDGSEAAELADPPRQRDGVAGISLVAIGVRRDLLLDRVTRDALDRSLGAGEALVARLVEVHRTCPSHQRLTASASR
ncbi:MAG: hypothetical protein IT307_17175 [Chloroflexi bacterium]|nr:hypothetical protein [Chloroflexota bacterium]